MRQRLPVFASVRTHAAPFASFLMLCAFVGGLPSASPPDHKSASDPPSAQISSLSQPVVWNGTATGTGAVSAAGEDTAVEGFNADTFLLNVTGTEAEWAGKYIEVKVTWTIPVNDYDLYIRKGSNEGTMVGNSGGGAPGTQELTTIVPASYGVGPYAVRVLYFSTTPGLDQYRATATVKSLPAGRPAIYMSGGMAFSKNRRVTCPVAEADGEPSSRCDAQGNYYISAIRGVPAGCDLWYFDLRPGSSTYDPNMRNPIYRGQPDSFTEEQSTQVGADGGGDVDIAVGYGNGPNGVPTLAFTSLVASNIFTAKSNDLGQSWTKNNAGNITGGAPVDDRQWIEFWGKDKVYLLYRTLAPAVTQIQLSNDGGLTFGPARTAGAIGQVGSVDVDQNDGTVYIAGSSGQVAIGRVDPLLGEPVSYSTVQVGTDLTGIANIFPIVKVAPDGTVFYLYCNTRDVMLTHSMDKGLTWATPVRVSNGPQNKATLFPHMEVGPISLTGNGSAVGIVWYGTSSNLNDDSADWHVYYAISYNATSPMPTLYQARASDHVIHASNISTGGTLGSDNRNLLDYFQVCFDPLGAAVIGYTDDHNDFGGHTYVTRQITGQGLKGNKLTARPEGAQLPPSPPPPADGSQVSDPQGDVAYGLLGVLPTTDPQDILSVKYSGVSWPTLGMITCTMKVSKLDAQLPPLTNWRMHFTANAPGTGLNPGGESFASSDRGDQFWVRAFTRADNTHGFAWGIAKRNSDGSMTYTEIGPADAGSFDPLSKTITVKVAVAKLNAQVTHGPPILSGSVIAGLRAQTYTSGSGAVKRDATRGGGEFTIQ